MNDYFNADVNLEKIKVIQDSVAKQMCAIRLDWLVSLNTEHHQDALHIAKKFLTARNDFNDVKQNVERFYSSRHLFEPEFRDIKGYKSFDAFNNFIQSIYYTNNNNYKLVRKELKPIHTDERFVIFCADTYTKSQVLTHNHPVFDNNYYNFCLGKNEKDYVRYCKIDNNPESPTVNTLYFVRDLSRSTKNEGLYGKAKYEDELHVLLIHAGSHPQVTNAIYTSTTRYKSMEEVYIKFPYLLPYSNLLVHKE